MKRRTESKTVVLLMIRVLLSFRTFFPPLTHLFGLSKEMYQFKIASDKRFFFASRPTFQLSLNLNRLEDIREVGHPHELNRSS